MWKTRSFIVGWLFNIVGVYDAAHRRLSGSVPIQDKIKPQTDTNATGFPQPF